ncbi:hypothetical protein GALMADRAFT_147289 [Galerina marginata CBS 339.88]|uniref:Uncharacterized protein n=1 Tax=Galerina marginata (strain CBS 339.88) TaxID=685588 RepID=A0A067SHT5_GALM3|nr:hypothetical protein GALMADRAFT_147289 [Galerina marginata CBS 339.88]
MQFSAIFPAFILGCAFVQATPLSTAKEHEGPTLFKTTFNTTPDDVLSAALANHGLQSLVDPNAIHTTATSPIPETSLEKRQTNPIIVFCSGSNCSGSCFAFALIGTPLNTCFGQAPNPYFSFFISNPYYVELLFQVGVAANPSCNLMSIVPQTNTCFNISPFGQSWAALNTGVTF